MRRVRGVRRRTESDMTNSKPRPSRKRTREIREQKRSVGTSYTAAMRANDRTRTADHQLPPGLRAPLPELRLGTVRAVAAFARLRAEEAARKLRGSAVQKRPAPGSSRARGERPGRAGLRAER